MQLATAYSMTQRSRGFDRGYVAIDRDYAAIHRSRPTFVELERHRASIRRNADDTIDFEFYRNRAAALRGETRRQHATLRLICAGVLTLAMGAALVMAVATPVSAPAKSGVVAVTVSHKP